MVWRFSCHIIHFDLCRKSWNQPVRNQVRTALPAIIPESSEANYESPYWISRLLSSFSGSWESWSRFRWAQLPCIASNRVQNCSSRNIRYSFYCETSFRRGKKLVKAWILGAIVGFLLRRVVHLIYDPAVVSAVPFLLFISSGFFKGCFSFWGLMQTWSCVVADPLVNGRTNVFENFIHATIAIELKTGLRVPYWHILTGFAGMLIAAILYPWFHWFHIIRESQQRPPEHPAASVSMCLLDFEILKPTRLGVIQLMNTQIIRFGIETQEIQLWIHVAWSLVSRDIWVRSIQSTPNSPFNL